MSRRRAVNKRKGDAEVFAVDEDDGEERKEDKRQRHATAAAAASSSSAAGAAASSSAAAAPSAAAASSSASAAPAASSGPLNKLEKLDCAQCQGEFKGADGAARALPCGHVLCTDCIKDNLNRTPGSVVCPEGHGPQKISPPASAAPTVDDWINQLQPAKDLIAAIRNQQQLKEQNQQLMTQLQQQQPRCSYPDCKFAATHYCDDCDDLCSDHERARHDSDFFQSHKAKTMLIARKAAFVRDKKQNSIADAIRAKAKERVLQQQGVTQAAKDELKQLEAQTQLQLQQKRKKVESEEKSLSALKQTADQMGAVSASAVLKMEADRVAAEKAAAARPMRYSAILSKLSDARVADLVTLLPVERSLLVNAKRLYCGSQDGFNKDASWRACAGKDRLLTIVEVEGNGFVFAAYTAFRWPVAPDYALIADPSGESAIISLVNAHDRAVKLRLKESAKAKAGQVRPSFGPIFGDSDIALMCNGASAAAKVGNYVLPGSFEFDSVADGGAAIVYDKTLLAGDDRMAWIRTYFGAAKIEVWQL